MMSSRLTFVDDFAKLQRQVQKKGRRVLFWVGDWTRRRMQWTLKKRPPDRTTKTGKTTARWKREVEGGQQRPPYRKTGLLHDLVAFEVNQQRESVAIGPQLRNVKSYVAPHGKTIPQMLDEGGTATIPERIFDSFYVRGKKIERWGKTGRRITVRYRAFPFVDKVKQLATAALLQRLEKETL